MSKKEKKQDSKNSVLIKRISIYDIDGVLLDSSHRYRTIATKKGEKIDLQHWRENEHLLINDKKLPLCLQYEKDILTDSCFVIIATSRIMKSRDYAFIEENLGFPDSFVSRISNKQKGHDLKINGIQRAIQELNLTHVSPDKITVYEDNIVYLKNICDYFQCKGVYIPSKQGH